MICLRKADINDLSFLVEIDLLDEGVTPTEEIESNEKNGLIMYRISNRDKEYLWKTIYNEIDRSSFKKMAVFWKCFNYG